MPNNKNYRKSQETIAAVDLGSNSFSMVIARSDNGQLIIVDKLRESIRLGNGLTKNKTLDTRTAHKALECLSRFGQRLRGFSLASVRAVGTNTFRQIQDSGLFQQQAEYSLGYPIEIISGAEEARLIYMGVAHGLATEETSRLVIDIGGGSTELILGQGMTPGQRDSLYIGCLSLTDLMFSKAITEDAMESAILRTALEIRPIKKIYRDKEWQVAIGSSGTIKAIHNVILNNGWSKDDIDSSSLKKLRKKLIAAKYIDAIQLEGLSDERKPVFVGGVAILSALFQTLKIEKLKISDLALREGLLYELAGDERHQDIRDRTVKSLCQRFGVDEKQASMIEITANALLAQTVNTWNLTNKEDVRMLNWACRLHEIGLSLAHNGFHKHGAYIIENSDLPGFSRQEQNRLAVLIRNHRRKLNINSFKSLPKNLNEKTLYLCVLLRFSILMHRGRSREIKPLLKLDINDRKIKVNFPNNWLDSNPLTRVELQREADYLEDFGFKLKF